MPYQFTCKHCGSVFFRRRKSSIHHPQKFCSIACGNMASALPLNERFWSNVEVTGPDDCWRWKRHHMWSGYGVIMIDGKPRRAHRVAWELTNGPIPIGLSVLHNCPGGDNPGCVNPAHLFLETQADNMRDMAEKGRRARKPHR